MNIKTPLLDKRTSEDIYKKAIYLAKYYCPEWTDNNWAPDHFDPDDPGLVIFRLFSNVTGFLINQLNKVPDKHRIAFLDFMGLALLPAQPARVPLTFYLAEGASSVNVPPGTLVASSKDSEVVFETEQHLSVLPIKLSVFSVNPWNDSFTEHTNDILGKRERFSIFGKDKEEKHLDHVLHLGDDIFDAGEPIESLKVIIQGNNLSPEYFDRWFDHENVPLDVQITQSSDTKKTSLEFSVKNIQKIQRSSIDNINTFWISIRPNEESLIYNISESKSELPYISQIKADITMTRIEPDNVYLDNSPVDAKKGFYPFGETPKEGNILYISSEKGFSKKDSNISLNIEIEKDLENASVQLLWEYWNGNSWNTLSISEDNTVSFTKAGISQIKFICPFIAPLEINGQLSRWIRVKIISGGYGNADKFEQSSLDDIITLLPEALHKDKIKAELKKMGISFGFQYFPSSFTPPFIKSMNLGYVYTDREIQRIVTYNNFRFRNFSKEKHFKPYEPYPNNLPAFLLGFENIAKNIPITLFFSVKDKIYGENIDIIYRNLDKTGNEVSEFVWKYNDGSIWKELIIEEDQRNYLNIGGVVCFLFPSDIQRTAELGKNLFWIKVEPKEGDKLSCPKLQGIFPNTVWAINNSTIKDEVLGSGNNTPGQSFYFSKKPVLGGEIIEIDEVIAWIKWHEVKDFAFSDQRSRVYVIDRANGKITFGDGLRGMMPPKGRNNILARQYKSGGGKRGNLEPGTIKLLRRTIPNLDRVINHISSYGGLDQEDIMSAVDRGPNSFKNRNRAVTREDFEWLAREASQNIIRANCILDNSFNITVIILQDKKGDTPQPDARLIETVEKYLKKRALLTIRERIQVIGPEYKKIDLKIKVKPVSINESIIVSDKIKDSLRTFLHPLKGGQYKEGWNFGSSIYFSEIAAIVEEIDGIDYIEKIEGGEELPGAGWISIDEKSLPCPGNIEVEIINEE